MLNDIKELNENGKIKTKVLFGLIVSLVVVFLTEPCPQAQPVMDCSETYYCQIDGGTVYRQWEGFVEEQERQYQRKRMRNALPVVCWLIGITILLAVIYELWEKSSKKPCPYCKKTISRDAIKCPYCQSSLTKSAEIE